MHYAFKLTVSIPTKTSAQMSESHRLMKYSSEAARGPLFLHISPLGHMATEISTNIFFFAAEIDSTNLRGYRPPEHITTYILQ